MRVFVVLCVAGLLVAGCGTIEGIGEDISSAARTVRGL